MPERHTAALPAAEDLASRHFLARRIRSWGNLFERDWSESMMSKRREKRGERWRRTAIDDNAFRDAECSICRHLHGTQMTHFVTERTNVLQYGVVEGRCLFASSSWQGRGGTASPYLHAGTVEPSPSCICSKGEGASQRSKNVSCLR